MLGVYASAVHARWVDQSGRVIVNALAVASEPEIFWRGQGAAEIVASISVPQGAGRLEPANRALNGPSGVTLDEAYLVPLLGSTDPRNRAWLCDLLPESRCNQMQAAALEREYVPLMDRYGLPKYDFPPVPAQLTNIQRNREIEEEIIQASPAVLVTLGDQPLKWFTSAYGSRKSLSSYGESAREYGSLHRISIGGHDTWLLPLVHPRQAGRLGRHSHKWHSLHSTWIESKANSVMASISE